MLAFAPVAGLTLAAAPAQASTTWYWFNVDRDSYWDAAARDLNALRDRRDLVYSADAAY